MAPANHFVDNAALYEAYKKYHDRKKAALQAGKPIPPLSDIIGRAVLLIATNLARKSNFRFIPYKDELVGDAIIACVKYAHNFDPAKSNKPFSYITMICKNAFLQRIQKEKKEAMIKRSWIRDVAYPQALSPANMAEDGSGGEGEQYVGFLMKYYDELAVEDKKLGDSKK